MPYHRPQVRQLAGKCERARPVNTIQKPTTVNTKKMAAKI
jgi:hypothetical protein